MEVIGETKKKTDSQKGRMLIVVSPLDGNDVGLNKNWCKRVEDDLTDCSGTHGVC